MTYVRLGQHNSAKLQNDFYVISVLGVRQFEAKRR